MSQKKKKGISLKSVLVILISAFIVVMSMTFLVYSLMTVQEVRVYDMSIMVGDYIGFDNNKTVLTFGMVPPGSGSAWRFIDVKTGRFPTVVFFSFEGEMADWVQVEDGELAIEIPAYTDRRIKIHAHPPIETQFGNYTGKAKMIIKKNVFG